MSTSLGRATRRECHSASADQPRAVRHSHTPRARRRRGRSPMRSLRAFIVPIVALCGTGCWQDELHQGAARLAVMAAGQVASLASADDGCGFGSLSTMLLGVAGLA